MNRRSRPLPPPVVSTPPAESPAAEPKAPDDTAVPGLSRRGFLSGTALAASAAALGGVAATTLTQAPPARADEIGPATGATRAGAAQKVRIDAAAFQKGIPLPAHPDNLDESRYGADRWASYSKALVHKSDGSVDTGEYTKLLTALKSGKASDFELIKIPDGQRKLVDPLAAYAYSLVGADSHAFGVPPAPAAGSDQIQGEMAELYWMALARDVPFDKYADDATGVIASAITDLNQFGDFGSPKVNRAITTQSLFRDNLLDNLTGNFISQYLLQTVPYGAQQILQSSHRRDAGLDQMTSYSSWFDVQQGIAPAPLPTDTSFHYLRNGRDLAEWVHSDFPAQSSLNAARIIAAQGAVPVPPVNPNLKDTKYSPGINDSANPYAGYKSQFGFVTFGNQAFFDLVTSVMQLALQAAWYQKWLVHRRIRPEEYGGRVDSVLRRSASYGVGSTLTTSLQDPKRLGRTFTKYNSYLLPQAFVEGSPTHPAYPSGHSTYVGAGVTMIKAFVDGTKAVTGVQRVSDPANGDNIVDDSTSLTINGELDKLVMNIGMGRLFAGVHWRSDHTYGIRLGELVAIRALQDLARTYAEPFTGFDLRRFDGSTVKITSNQVTQNGSPVATDNVVLVVPPAP